MAQLSVEIIKPSGFTIQAEHHFEAARQVRHPDPNRSFDLPDEMNIHVPQVAPLSNDADNGNGFDF